MSNASDCMSRAPAVPEWMHLLDRAVAATSVAEVARRLGVARSSLSLLINGKYPGGTDNMAARVMDVLAEPCPVYGGGRTSESCVSRRAEPMPTSNPFALRQWRMCQLCNLWSDENER
ncbi:helix-turn-helix transcriptional regulator [uncultured Desulfovibrio sp.]|uniref:helix-turn-helix domain-containing protein n=1 Tax=uncultured Desulfovibrio sp. TaxID=167968 RepID=UPI002062401D|nr:helix-turn-helix transcriptional regulator [uncultured Desulfovibrio sp.]DAJ56725.1 MAG TPA: Putative TetR-family transcriptional regulator [Caudoviricetes sp.]